MDLHQIGKAIDSYFSDKSRSPSATLSGLLVLQDQIDGLVDALKDEGVKEDADE